MNGNRGILLVAMVFLGALACRSVSAQVRSATRAPTVNFEAGPVTPLLLSPDGGELYVLNTPDHRLEVYATRRAAASVPGLRATSTLRESVPLRFLGSVFTGLEPVSLAFHQNDARTLFVSNHVSDTVSVVDLDTRQVVATLRVGDEPQGLVVANGKLFVACSRTSVTALGPGELDPMPMDSHVVVVHDASPPFARLAVVALGVVKPRDLIAKGDQIYVIPQSSGNHTTLLDQYEAEQHGLTQLTRDGFDPPFEVNSVLTHSALAFNLGWFIPAAGRIVFDWEYPGVVPQLADRDLLAIDQGSHAVTTVATGVGTVLLDIAENPLTGHLWIAGTEARNRTRFEPALRGRAIENRVTIIDPAAPTPQVIALEPPRTPRPYAQPTALAFSSSTGPHAFVAALGSRRVVVLDARTGNYVTEIPTAPLPSGLAVDDLRQLLYVFCRGDFTVQVFDLARGFALQKTRRLSYLPEPLLVRRGRQHLYDAEAPAGNGSMSCASCHVFGHNDRVAWDLGSPGGSFAYCFPDLLQGFGSYAGEIAVSPTAPMQNPLKGPAMTQSLRGLLEPDTDDDLPLHWRGDRRFVHMFQGAFVTLLSGGGITRQTMQEFGAFLRATRFAPNPLQQKDRVYTGESASGADIFGMNPQLQGKPMNPGGSFGCITCHESNFLDGSDWNGSRNAVGPVGFEQVFQTPSFRFVFEKEARDETGFGLLHDGQLPDILAALNFVPPGGTAPAVPNFTDQDKIDVAAFLRRWDTGMAPLVGAQFTADSASLMDAPLYLDLAEAQAQAAIPAVDLILKGARDDLAGGLLPRGALFQPHPITGVWGYQFDTGDFASRDAVLAAVNAGIATFTFTCVPPGLGERLGIDQDEDGLLDFEELELGTDPRHPDSDRDGFSDGLEVSLGADPTVVDDTIPDTQAPEIDSVRAVEIFADVATLVVVADEPAVLVVELGLTAGQADLGTRNGRGLRSRHSLVLGNLPAGVEIFFAVTLTDHSGNVATTSGSFRTLPPMLHVQDITLTRTGSGPYTVTARLLVHDHRGQSVDDVPVRGFWHGDIGGQSWTKNARTDASGWATFTLAPYTPAGPTTVTFSPNYLGSDDPSDPYFVGFGGDTEPPFFYDQSANRVHFTTVSVP